jgi:hypothetical protein
MTEKEIKAREIVIKMQFQKEPLMFEQAKQCALICVDEILSSFQFNKCDSEYDYYLDVKTEIEKL